MIDGPKEKTMTSRKLAPIHPGEILNEEFLKPMRISQSKLARVIDVPHRRVNEIVLGKRGITPDTAMRFAVHFGTSAEFWMNLQITYDLRVLQNQESTMYSKIPSLRETLEILADPKIMAALRKSETQRKQGKLLDDNEVWD